jgi:transcriptional regulator with XRE-family HTH domain
MPVRNKGLSAAPTQGNARSKASRIAPDLSARVREICRTRDLSLRQLSALSGIPIATLSKVQNNLTTLSYVQLAKLAEGLGIELNELFTATTSDVRTGRRAVTRRGGGPQESTERYDFEMLCGDLANKKMNIGIMHINARSLEEAGGLIAHEGEEFAFVLAGSVDVYTEDYTPMRLEAGDCIYMDSTSAHVYVNVGPDAVARVLAVTTHGKAGRNLHSTSASD